MKGERLRHVGGGQLYIYDADGKPVRPVATTIFNNWRDRDRVIMLWNDEAEKQEQLIKDSNV